MRIENSLYYKYTKGRKEPVAKICGSLRCHLEYYLDERFHWSDYCFGISYNVHNGIGEVYSSKIIFK